MERSFNPPKGCDSQVVNHEFSGSFPYGAPSQSGWDTLFPCVLCFHLWEDETRVQPSTQHYQERWWTKEWRRKQEGEEEEEEEGKEEDKEKQVEKQEMKEEKKEDRRKRGGGTARKGTKNFKLRSKDLQELIWNGGKVDIFKINAWSTLSRHQAPWWLYHESGARDDTWEAAGMNFGTPGRKLWDTGFTLWLHHPPGSSHFVMADAETPTNAP